MNAAATHLQSNVANGKETREFLGQSVGFENELISQTNFPRQPSARIRSRAANFSLFGQALRDVLETVPNPPPPGRNMPSTVWVRQGGKLPRENRACRFRMRHKSHGAAARPAGSPSAPSRPQAVINGVLWDLRHFTQYFRRQRIIARFR